MAQTERRDCARNRLRGLDTAILTGNIHKLIHNGTTMAAANTVDSVFRNSDGVLVEYVRDGNNFVGLAAPAPFYDLGDKGVQVVVDQDPRS